MATAAGAAARTAHRPVVALQRAQHADVRDLDLRCHRDADKVYYAVWGSGVLEYDQQTRTWKDYDDPDGETEIVLFKDQGLIHEITTSVSYVNKILWVATYFGDSRYDGRNWQNFLTKDSGLPTTSPISKRRRCQSCLVLHRQGPGLLRRRELGRLSSFARPRASPR